MATPEGAPIRRTFRVGTLLVGVAIVVIVALIAHELTLTNRIAALEAAVAQRDAADPLMPFECRHSLPVRGEISGNSRDKPCFVAFQRLLDAPQQFEGRWVEVQGRYASGFETSALFPLDSKPPSEGWESYEHALWVGVQPFAKADTQNGVVFVGRFRRGPAGHLGQYFAALDNR